jgi:hypothetical protein
MSAVERAPPEVRANPLFSRLLFSATLLSTALVAQAWTEPSQ